MMWCATGKFMKHGRLDRDTEELLLSRVSVKDAVDLVSQTTLQRVRNPSALAFFFNQNV